jgi:hypothetical protein
MYPINNLDSYVVTPGTNLVLRGPVAIVGYFLHAAAADTSIKFYKDTVTPTKLIWADELDIDVIGKARPFLFGESTIGCGPGESIIVVGAGAAAEINVLARGSSARLTATPV